MPLDKKQAAEYLKITIRALENLVTKGRIHPQRIKGIRGVVEWRFEPDELDRYAREKQQTVFLPAVETRQALVAPPIEKPDFERVIQALEELRQPLNSSLQDIAVKFTLSLDEASQLSGFSTHQLRDAIKDGKLKAIPIGATGKRKRIRRDDLATYIKKL
jgi:excisionase family DNA binding protein